MKDYKPILIIKHNLPLELIDEYRDIIENKLKDDFNVLLITQETELELTIIK